MKRLKLLLVLLFVGAGVGAGQVASSSTAAQSSETKSLIGSVVPALTTLNPHVTVTPNSGLFDGEAVTVAVSGFGVGGKVWLSECASASDVTDLGCGAGLPSQTLVVTDETRAGSVAFVVHDPAPSKPNYRIALRPCSPACVVVATLGVGGGHAYAPIRFHRPRLPGSN